MIFRNDKKTAGAIPLIAGLLLCLLWGEAMGAEDRVEIGLVEDVVLMPWGVKLPARIDTGAAMTSLDARRLKVRGDVAEFSLPKEYGGLKLSLPIVKWMRFRSSESRDRRPVVEMDLCVGNRLIRTQLNLNNRSGVEYPLLLGRNVLQRGFVIDCTKENCAPPSCPEVPR
jgi:hypothetical protein